MQLPKAHPSVTWKADSVWLMDSLTCAGLSKLKGVHLDPVESNIVIFRLSEGMPSMSLVMERLKEAGVLMGGMRGGIRAVTHSQVSAKDCQRALVAVQEALVA